MAESSGMGPLANLAKLLNEKKMLEEEVKNDNAEIAKALQRLQNQNYAHLTITNTTEAIAAKYFAEESGWTGKLAIIANKRNTEHIKQKASNPNFTSTEVHHTN